MKTLITLLLIATLAGCVTSVPTYSHTWTENGIPHEIKAQSLQFAIGNAKATGVRTGFSFKDKDKTVTFGQILQAETETEALSTLPKILLAIP